MKKYTLATTIKIFVLAIPAALFFMMPGKAEAAFNPSYIISNDRFLAKATMTETEIQTFLTENGNYLESYTVPAGRYVTWDGVSYWESPWIGPVGQEVNATGWSAAKVIYNVANWYNINPQVLLATIQKESSLVTTNPAYYGLVQWAMGYAYTEGGIINVCITDTNNNPTGSCAGFAMQVDWGGGMLARWANSGGHYLYPVGSTKSIDGVPTYIGNAATSVLYAYTPHFHGNENFYNLYVGFFGSAQMEGFYLIVDKNNPTGVYMVLDGYRRGVPQNVFNSWGLAKYPLEYVESDYFLSIPEGTQLTKLVANSGSVYFVDRGAKLGIPSPEIFELWGFSWDDIVFMDSFMITYLPTGLNLGPAFQSEATNGYYIVDNAVKRIAINKNIASYYHGFGSAIPIISEDYYLRLDLPITEFFVSGPDGKKYMITNGKKSLIDNETISSQYWVFNIGGGVGGYNNVSDKLLLSLATTNNLDLLVREYNKDIYYIIYNGKKIAPLNDAIIAGYGFSKSNAFALTKATLDIYPTGEAFSLLASYNGRVFLAQNGKLRPVFDADTFNIFKYNWGFDWGDIKPITANIYSLKGEGALITFPRLVTYSTGGTVYRMDDDGKRPIDSADTFNEWAFNWGSIFYTRNDSFLNSYPSPAPLSILASNNGGVYLIDNGTKRPITSPEAFNNLASTDPRVRWDKIYPVSSGLLGTLPLGAEIN